MVEDRDIIKLHPTVVSSKIQQAALTCLRQSTQSLQGDERWDAMQEQAAEVFVALGEAIDTIEKDITYNPAEFLGFPLYPD